jgi:hypothetical protein
MYNTKCLTEIEYGPHGDEIWFLSYFHHEKMFFGKTKGRSFGFWVKTWYFSKPQKNIDNIIMSNRARIWILTCFRCEHTFLVKPMTTPFGFEPKLDILLKSQKIVYNTIMSNRARIWASQGWNTDFQPSSPWKDDCR